ncbi:MAG: hypothetical protein D6794_04790 [Deltaproteobacteria bacterium]|nr:MAG: hypothetical protein D6794_04790 [Deltaproteobacteria bacterium]
MQSEAENRSAVPSPAMPAPGADLAGRDFSGLDLSGANLSGANLQKARFFQTDLRGVDLSEADLRGAEFAGADLRDAILDGARAMRAGFGGANLSGASLFGADLREASLTQACLNGANLGCADLRGARLREASLKKAHFDEADMRQVDMSLSDVSKASFQNADLRQARLRRVKGFRNADWLGVDIRDINFAGAYMMRREIIDQNYIREFRNHSKVTRLLYWPWWLTCDCGRSMLRWCFWIGVQVLFFAWLYTLTGVDYGRYPTDLSPLYYSVVTLTTLGYGDVVPQTPAAQLVAMIEVTIGYVMLGGLLSIFSNKLARRGD